MLFEYAAPLLALLCLLFLGLLLMARSNVWRLIFLWSLGFCLILFVAWCLRLSWIFRDGLAPGMVVSHGRTALYRFLEDTWPVFVFALAIAIGAYFANRRALRKIKARNTWPARVCCKSSAPHTPLESRHLIESALACHPWNFLYYRFVSFCFFLRLRKPLNSITDLVIITHQAAQKLLFVKFSNQTSLDFPHLSQAAMRFTAGYQSNDSIALGL